jgi:hypothetical protein
MPYYSIRTELSVTSDRLILYGKRIVIPKKLQDEIINKAHQSHQGREKTKQLLNQFVWFSQFCAKEDKFWNPMFVAPIRRRNRFSFW